MFGRSCTRTLAYIALNPLKTQREIQCSLGLPRWAVREQFNQRLCTMGVVIRHQTDDKKPIASYELNPALSGYEELRKFLVELGAAQGMTQSSPTNGVTLASSHAAQIQPVPLSLFWEPTRGKVLALIATFGELYAFELVTALSMNVYSAQTILRKLLNHGLLSERKPGRLRLFRINPRLAGAESLKNLLRQVVNERHELIAASQMMSDRRTAIANYRSCDGLAIATIDGALLRGTIR